MCARECARVRGCTMPLPLVPLATALRHGGFSNSTSRTCRHRRARMNSCGFVMRERPCACCAVLCQSANARIADEAVSNCRSLPRSTFRTSSCSHCSPPVRRVPLASPLVLLGPTTCRTPSRLCEPIFPREIHALSSRGRRASFSQPADRPLLERWRPADSRSTAVVLTLPSVSLVIGGIGCTNSNETQ